MSDLTNFSPVAGTSPQIAHDVREFFRQSVSSALGHQRVQASEDTVFYLVNLLAQFMRADALFECTRDGVFIKPLALCYADAVHAETRGARHQALKKLGDVALLVAGMFSASLSRKLVGLDYYVAMGGNAYGHLSSGLSGTPARIFSELASKFQAFVDVLGEVSDASSLRAPQDILRLYENWVRTGSRRAAAQLRSLGIEPSTGSVSLRVM